MTDEPLVTVVIPTYRRADIVARAIESARNQTYKNIEILVVDDGSPDDTASVVRSIADNRVHYLRHERNKGLPAVRNTGIRTARGKYIAFLDDDDGWHQDKLRRQMEAMNGHGAMLCGALVNGRRPKVFGAPVVRLEDLRRGNPFDPSSLVCSADIAKELLFDETLRQGEDWDFFIRLAQRVSIGYVQEPLIFYNDGEHERMTNQAKYLTGQALEARTAMLRKHREFFGERRYKYLVAGALLTYLDVRSEKFRAIAYAVERCGVIAVLGALCEKLGRHVKTGSNVRGLG